MSNSEEEQPLRRQRNTEDVFDQETKREKKIKVNPDGGIQVYCRIKPIVEPKDQSISFKISRKKLTTFSPASQLRKINYHLEK